MDLDHEEPGNPGIKAGNVPVEPPEPDTPSDPDDSPEETPQ